MSSFCAAVGFQANSKTTALQPLEVVNTLEGDGKLAHCTRLWNVRTAKATKTEVLATQKEHVVRKAFPTTCAREYFNVHQVNTLEMLSCACVME